MKFVCENCKREFNSIEDCKEHENMMVCLSIEKKQETELEMAIKMLCENSHVEDLDYEVETEEFVTYEEDDEKTVHFGLTVTLNNGLDFTITDAMINYGNLISRYDIVIYAENEINKRLKMSYEGVAAIKNDDGWYFPYIDETCVCDVIERFAGKRIRIEVIEN